MSGLITRRSFLAGCLTALAAGFGGDATAQELPEFAESVSVREVLVHVVVTDRQGRSVRDLQIDDFIATVDGEQVPINSLRQSVVLGERSASEEARPESAPEREPDGIDERPVTVVLYLDETNTHPSHRARILKRLRRAMEPMAGWNARFALATHRDNVRLQVPPSSDVETVLRAAETLTKGPAQAVVIAENLRRAREALEMFRASDSASQGIASRDPWDACDPAFATSAQILAQSRAEEYAAEELRRTLAGLHALGELVAGLAAIPGRKAVVYIGDGLPQSPGLEMYQVIAAGVCGGALRATTAEKQAQDLSRTFSEVTAYANAMNVTFYTLDAGGVPASLTEGKRHNLQAGMQTLAHETGGRTLFNSNDPGPLLRDVGQHLDSSYALAIEPQDHREGEVRNVTVELASHLRGAGYRLAYRRSWQDRSVENDLAQSLLGAAWLGGSTNPLNVLADVVPVPEPQAPKPRKERRKARKQDLHQVVVQVSVPAASATLIPGPEGERGAIRLWLVAMERDEGSRTPVRQLVIPIGGPEAPSPTGGHHRVSVGMKLQQGDHVVGIGVRDEPSGTMSLLRKLVTVPHDGQTAATLADAGP